MPYPWSRLDLFWYRYARLVANLLEALMTASTPWYLLGVAPEFTVVANLIIWLCADCVTTSFQSTAPTILERIYLVQIAVGAQCALGAGGASSAAP